MLIERKSTFNPKPQDLSVIKISTKFLVALDFCIQTTPIFNCVVDLSMLVNCSIFKNWF